MLAPFICGGASYLATRLSFALTRNLPEQQGRREPRFPLRARSGSSSLVALAHGTNDAQKTMGALVTLTLIAGGRLGA